MRELRAFEKNRKRRSWFGLRWGALEEDLTEALETERRIESELQAEIDRRAAEVRSTVDALTEELNLLKNREAALTARLRAIDSEMLPPAPPPRAEGAAADGGEDEQYLPTEADEKLASYIDEQNETLAKVLGVIERIEQQRVPGLEEEEAAAPAAPAKEAAPAAEAAAAVQSGSKSSETQGAQGDAKDLVMKGYRNAWGR